MTLLEPIQPVISLLMLMWLVHLLNTMGHGWLSKLLGLQPRSVFGLVTIVTYPLLHADFQHLWINSGAFLILGSLIAIQGSNLLIFVSALLVLITGISLWLFSSGRVVGVSGVNFGYLGFLLSFGGTVGDGLAFVAAALALVLYGGTWISIFPTHPRISWLAHFAGFVGGLGMGHLLALRALERSA